MLTRIRAGPAAAAPVRAEWEIRGLVIGGRYAIPAGAMALSDDVTDTGAATEGEMILFRADLPCTRDFTSFAFWTGVNRANDFMLQLPRDAAGRFNVYNRSSGTTQLVLELNG